MWCGGKSFNYEGARGPCGSAICKKTTVQRHEEGCSLFQPRYKLMTGWRIQTRLTGVDNVTLATVTDIIIK